MLTHGNYLVLTSKGQLAGDSPLFADTATSRSARPQRTPDRSTVEAHPSLDRVPGYRSHRPHSTI